MADTRERAGRDKEDVHQMLVRLPKDLAERLRRRSFDEDRSKVAIIRDALGEYLTKRGA